MWAATASPGRRPMTENGWLYMMGQDKKMDINHGEKSRSAAHRD
jgi:hypothetical protein